MTDGELKGEKARKKTATGLGDKPSEVSSESVSHQHLIEVEAMWTPGKGHRETRARQGQAVGGGGNAGPGVGEEHHQRKNNNSLEAAVTVQRGRAEQEQNRGLQTFQWHK